VKHVDVSIKKFRPSRRRPFQAGRRRDQAP
jgi:hypothetical protein